MALPLSARYFSERTLLADRFLYLSPECFELTAREVEFPAADGTKLRGWFFPGEKDGTIVFCSGNSNNVSCHLEYVRMICETGHSVLAFDYRGFGRSDGVPDLRRVVDDVVSAVHYTREALAPSQPLGLFGMSMGASTALAAATRVAEGVIRSVVVESLSDFRDMLVGLFTRGAFGPLWVDRVTAPDGSVSQRDQLRFKSIRVVPWLARICARGAAPFYPFPAQRPRSFVRGLRNIPVFLIHGVYDALLPFEAAVELYEALPSDSKRLWLIPGAGHPQEASMSHRAEYCAQVADFFATTLNTDRLSGAGVRRSASAGGVTLTPVANGFPASLLTVVTQDSIVQRVVSQGASVEVERSDGDKLVTVLGTRTLAADGFPGAEQDPLSRRYRAGGYQTGFRQLVKAMNHMDFAAFDTAIEGFLRLPRAYPFDFLASVYCVRIAYASIVGVPGWPSVGPKVLGRTLERLLELWCAHECLPGEDIPESPAAWAKSQLERLTRGGAR